MPPARQIKKHVLPQMGIIPPPHMFHCRQKASPFRKSARDRWMINQKMFSNQNYAFPKNASSSKAPFLGKMLAAEGGTSPASASGPNMFFKTKAALSK